MAIETFKVKIGIASIIKNKIFTIIENKTYNLRSGMYLSRVNVHSIQFGTESIGNLGAQIWNLVKDLKTLSTFNNQMKAWIAKYCPCPCRLRKACVAQVRFL